VESREKEAEGGFGASERGGASRRTRLNSILLILRPFKSHPSLLFISIMKKADKDEKKETVKVAVRCRPLNER
jgi:hypothetical protein